MQDKSKNTCFDHTCLLYGCFSPSPLSLSMCMCVRVRETPLHTNLYQWVKAVDVCLDHLDSSSHGSKLSSYFLFNTKSLLSPRLCCSSTRTLFLNFMPLLDIQPSSSQYVSGVEYIVTFTTIYKILNMLLLMLYRIL